MAKPIKETPVLKGRDAVRFLTQMQKNDNKKAPDSEKKEISDSFDRISAIAAF